MATRPALGIGMVGYAFMGKAHANAWRQVKRFYELPLRPELVVVAGRTAEGVEAARERLGWREATTDWRTMLTRDDVHLIDVCTPGSSHAEVAIAALEAGKHVLCEKPLANSVEEAEAMVAAARSAAPDGVKAMVAFNYRRVPALELARRLIAEGRLGTVRHVRARYMQDWIVDPEFPLVWRLVGEEAGSGALGDIGAHIVDIAQHLIAAPITTVSALTETFVRERPLPGRYGGLAAAGDASGERGAVTVDDAALFLARFGNGAVGTFEATRFALGRRNGMGIEIYGSKGSLRFDVERLNELELYESEADATTEGFRRILVTEPMHPWLEGWWPTGHILGWEHTFTHEVHDLVHAIARDEQPSPSFEDGLQVQRVLLAVERSAADGRWADV